MRKFFILISILLFAANVFAGAVKKADLAGTWYPSDKVVLSSQLDSSLNTADVGTIKDDIRAIIVPHAGLVYSGPVAAYAYKAVQGKNFTTVLLLGFCHRYHLDGISVYKEGYFDTPLGSIEVDSKLANTIIGSDKKIIFDSKAFENENSIEMELPFIKKVFPNSKIVPIAFGISDYNYCKLMADILAKILHERSDVLLVASTDMSHFHPYDEAREIDLKSIELLKKFAAREIYERSIIGEQIFCGYMPVTTALLACKKIGADEMSILKYANSGEVTGDRGKVVGYVSAAIYKSATNEKQEGEQMLSEAQRKRLVEIARNTIRTYLETGKVLDVKEDDPVFNREMGAFVTLHKKGQLRGCIGNIIGRGPLYLTVRGMAIESATGDPRFPKVTLKELDDIDIEISVLSELEKVENADKIEMGVHGVLIRKGFASGVFLPQVATETGWSKEEFLTNLCTHKAGLLPDAWKTGDADIYIFSAEVFGEKE
jgi:AmmeMemoRadiSam system protein B/AmmeMemoRadiSam system protein A